MYVCVIRSYYFICLSCVYTLCKAICPRTDHNYHATQQLLEYVVGNCIAKVVHGPAYSVACLGAIVSWPCMWYVCVHTVLPVAQYSGIVSWPCMWYVCVHTVLPVTQYSGIVSWPCMWYVCVHTVLPVVQYSGTGGGV